MEASVAAEAADGAAVDAAGGAEQGAGGGLDLSPVFERIDGLAGKFDAFQQSFGAGGGGGQQDDDDGLGEFDLESLFGDDEAGQQGARALNPQAIQELVSHLVQQGISEHVGPLSEQVRSVQMGLDAEALTARYPDLGKPEVARPVVDAARALAESLGSPELAFNTQFIEAIYKAQLADQYAAGERPVGAEQGFELERGAGAGPSAGDEQNMAERIVARRQGAQSWPPQW